MIGIIKTAIITIIISFISGVLLDFYKSKAPKVLCSIKRDKPMLLGGKRINVYSLMIKNDSNKTIHDLNLNVQGHYDNLKIDNATITKGLKFEISEEDEVYDVSIPFLCKDDEFTAKVFAYSHDGSAKKPYITLRSPEKFKKVYSEKESRAAAAICNIVSKNKKTIAVIISVLVIVYAGITIGEHFHRIGSKINVDNIKNKIESVKKSSENKGSSNSGSEKSGSQEKSNSNSNVKSSSDAGDRNKNNGSVNKSNSADLQSKSAGSTNNDAQNKQQIAAEQSGSGSESGKSSVENGTNKNQPAQQSETGNETSTNGGQAADKTK